MALFTAQRRSGQPWKISRGVKIKEKKTRKKVPDLQALVFNGDCNSNGAVSHRKTFELNAGSYENDDLGN